MVRDHLNYFSSYRSLTVAILLERLKKRCVLLVGLADLPLIVRRIEAIEPPDFLRPGERLHRQIRMWTPKFGAQAGSLLLDLTISLFTTGYQRLASDKEYRLRNWHRLHHGESQQNCGQDWHLGIFHPAG